MPRRFWRPGLLAGLIFTLGLACNLSASSGEETEAVPTWALASRLTATALQNAVATAPSTAPAAATTASGATPLATVDVPEVVIFTSIPPTASPGVHAARALTPPPVLDGDLAEWEDLPNQIEQAVFGPGNWRGPDDLSGTWDAAWDDEYLYLAIQVRDDAFVQLATGNQIFRGDSAELLLDADLVGDAATRQLNGDDYQLGVSPGDLTSAPGQPAVYLWYPAEEERGLTEVVVVARLTDQGYDLEFGVPWAIFGLTPAGGQTYGFALSLNDDDSAGSPQQESIVSSAPRRVLTDPATWGRLVLDPAP